MLARNLLAGYLMQLAWSILARSMLARYLLTVYLILLAWSMLASHLSAAYQQQLA